LTLTAFRSDTALFEALPTDADPVVPNEPSVAEQVTSNIGVIAMAVAATMVIVALIFTVNSTRHSLSTSRHTTAVALSQRNAARAAADASDTQAQAEHAAGLATVSDLSTRTRQLSDLRTVALRANTCIEIGFETDKVLITGTHAQIMNALDVLGTVCSGLGPQLKGTSTST